MKLKNLSILHAFRNQQFALLPHLPSQHIPLIVHQIVTVLTCKPDRDSHRASPYEVTALVTRAQQEALLHVPRSEHGLRAAYEQALTPLSVIRQSEAHGHGFHGLAGTGKQPPIRHFWYELRDFWHPKQDSRISALSKSSAGHQWPRNHRPNSHTLKMTKNTLNGASEKSVTQYNATQ